MKYLHVLHSTFSCWNKFITMAMYYYYAYFDLILFAPAAQGFRADGEIPRRHSSNSRVY